MNRIAIILLLLVIAATGTFTVTAQAPAEKQPTLLSALKVGQPVSLREVSGRYELTTVAGVEESSPSEADTGRTRPTAHVSTSRSRAKL